MSYRIVFVAPFGLQHKTTVWARTLPIAQELVRLGHHATILIPPWDSPADAGRDDLIAGVRVAQLAVTGGIVPTVRRLLAAADAIDPHIVHIVKPRAHAGLVQWWRWQCRHTTHARLVLDIDDWEQAWNPVNRYPWHVGQFLAWQERWGIRHAHGITAASRWLEAKVAAMAPTTSPAMPMPLLYLPNGVNPLDEPPLPPPRRGAPRILFFTRFVEVTPAWLRAFWEQAHTLLPSAELVIAGTPVQPWLAAPFQSALADMAQVRWLGYVPRESLRELYAQATCAIFPAQPIPLLQAKCSVRLATTLLYGVPVVASAVGEHVNYGADSAARLVPAEATAAEFASAVAETIQHSDQTAQARKQATARMLERYAWSRLVAPLPDFYTALLGQG